MITPTDDQVEAAISVIDFALEARGLKNAISANAYPSADGGADIDNGALPQIEITLRDIVERVAAKALTAAFSLAPAGTVEVKPLEWGQNWPNEPNSLWVNVETINRQYTIDPESNVFRLSTALVLSEYGSDDLGLHPTLDAAKAAAQTDLNARIVALLPPQPSADLPVKDVGEPSLEDQIREWRKEDGGDSVDHHAYRVAHIPEPSTLVSQPHPEGEAVAWMLDPAFHVEGVTQDSAETADWRSRYPGKVKPLYLHPAPHKAENEGLVEALADYDKTPGWMTGQWLAEAVRQAVNPTDPIGAERHKCASGGPCSVNGDGCSCSDAELLRRAALLAKQEGGK